MYVIEDADFPESMYSITESKGRFVNNKDVK